MSVRSKLLIPVSAGQVVRWSGFLHIDPLCAQKCINSGQVAFQNLTRNLTNVMKKLTTFAPFAPPWSSYEHSHSVEPAAQPADDRQ